MVPCTLGIDVGGTKVLGVAIDEHQKVFAEARVSTPLSHHQVSDPDAAARVIEAIAAVVSQLLSAAGLEGSNVALGVGIPGLVDDSGTMHFAPNLPAGVGVDFRPRVMEVTGLSEVVIDNDATCAAIGEWQLGAARGATDAIIVTLGTGIGAGIIANNALVRGAHGYAGEAGHMVVDPSGPLCSCGRRGCWERYASGSGLARLARESASAGRLGEVVALAKGDAESVRGEHVTEAAAASDPGALEVMAEFGWWIALGVANLTALLDPSVVVLGGGLAQAGDLLINPTRLAYEQIAYARSDANRVEIVRAELGELAGAVGAAVLAEAGITSRTDLRQLRRR
ncbi:MAG: ROK family protein [Acidimicrobiales bacterium]